jgi:hypothetical protein
MSPECAPPENIITTTRHPRRFPFKRWAIEQALVLLQARNQPIDVNNLQDYAEAIINKMGTIGQLPENFSNAIGRNFTRETMKELGITLIDHRLKNI